MSIDHSIRIAGLSLSAGAALLLGCNGDKSTAPPPPKAVQRVSVSLAVRSPAIHPGDVEVLEVAVTTPDGGTVTSAQVVFTGALNQTVDLPVPGPGPFGYTVTVAVPHGPYRGDIAISAIARLGQSSATATGSFSITDDGPPRLQLQWYWPPEPNDTMRLGVDATDDAGITRLAFNATGALTAAGDSLEQDSVEHRSSLALFIPRGVALGDTLHLSVTVWDAFGNWTTSAISPAVRDFRPPTLDLTASPGRYDSVLTWRGPIHFVGDTLSLTLQAHDNLSVAWIGWRIAALRMGDSVQATDTVGQADFRIVVTPTMDGLQDLQVFTRDASGNETLRDMAENLVAGTRRSYQMYQPPYGYDPADWVYDQPRGIALVLSGAAVTAFSVSPFNQVGMALLPGTGGNGLSVDVAPGGDTAWTAGEVGPTLSAVELVQLPINPGRSFGIGDPNYPWRMRLTPDGHAVVTDRDTTGFVLVNLATGSWTRRGKTWFPQFLTASSDRTLILGYDTGGEVRAYYAAIDSVGSLKVIGAGIPSVDRAGDLVLIGNKLYDGQLVYLRDVGPQDYAGLTSILSADGQFAYFARWPGYHKLRTSDGMVVEKVFLPELGTHFLEIPDRNLLLVFGRNTHALVDLGAGGIVAPGSPAASAGPGWKVAVPRRPAARRPVAATVAPARPPRLPAARAPAPARHDTIEIHLQRR